MDCLYYYKNKNRKYDYIDNLKNQFINNIGCIIFEGKNMNYIISNYIAFISLDFSLKYRISSMYDIIDFNHHDFLKKNIKESLNNKKITKELENIYYKI